MQILISHTLLLFLTLLSFHHINCQNTDELDLLIQQLYEPYQNHITSFTETLKQAFYDTLKSLLATPLDKYDIEEDYQRPSINHKSQYINKSALGSEITPNEPQSERMLQYSEGICLNGGYAITAMVNVYICGEVEVSKEQYQADKSGKCFIGSTHKELCYCPFDYYGNNCERYNTIFCQISSASHPLQKCDKPDSKYFVYSYGESEMPCYSIPENTQLKLDFTVKCEHQYKKWAFEGIKGLESGEYKIPPMESKLGKYIVDTPDLKMSNVQLFSLRLRFINWKRVSKPYVMEHTLTAQEIIGQENVTFSVLLDSKMTDYRLAGRYHYELDIPAEKTVLYNLFLEKIFAKKMTGVIENASFKEPVRGRFTRNYKILIYAVMLCLISTAIFFCVKNKRGLLKLNGQGEERYAQLIELSEANSSVEKPQHE